MTRSLRKRTRQSFEIFFDIGSDTEEHVEKLKKPHSIVDDDESEDEFKLNANVPDESSADENISEHVTEDESCNEDLSVEDDIADDDIAIIPDIPAVGALDDKENSTNISTETTRRNTQLLINALNSALSCLSKEIEITKTRKKRGRKSKSELETPIEEKTSENIRVLLLPKQEDGRYKCPLPICSKIFKSLTAFKYHATHFTHSISHLFAYFAENENVLNFNLKAALDEIGSEFSETELSSSEVNIAFEESPIASTVTLHFDIDWKQKPKLPEETSTKRYEKYLSTKLLKELDVDAPIPHVISHNDLDVDTRPLFTDLKFDPSSFVELDMDSAQEYFIREPLDISCKTNLEVSHFSMDTLTCQNLASNKEGYHINCGGAILCAEWMPHVPKNESQFLCVGADVYSSRFFGLSKQSSGNGTIQIWECPQGSIEDNFKEASPSPFLKLVICHSHGACLDLKWCPRGNRNTQTEGIGRLGILAAVFSDGTFCIYVIPDLQSHPTFASIEPFFSHRLLHGTYTKIAWSPHEQTNYLIATATSLGSVSIWNTSLFQNSDAQPALSFPIHDYHIGSICWSEKNPYTIFTGGHDGRLCISDIREGFGTTISKMAQFTTGLSMKKDMLFFSGLDNFVRNVHDENFGRTIFVSGHDNGVTCTSVSPYHDFIASSSNDGSVKITNIHLGRIRYQSGILVTLLKVGMGEDGRITIDENVKKQKLDSSNTEMVFKDVKSSMEVVKWNPHSYSSTWLLCGGRNGILRLQTTK